MRRGTSTDPPRHSTLPPLTRSLLKHRSTFLRHWRLPRFCFLLHFPQQFPQLRLRKISSVRHRRRNLLRIPNIRQRVCIQQYQIRKSSFLHCPARLFISPKISPGLPSPLWPSSGVKEGQQYSGSLISARLAMEAGREVFAVPGNVTQDVSFAPNQLLKQGAKLVASAEEVIEELPTAVRATLVQAEPVEAEQ